MFSAEIPFGIRCDDRTEQQKLLNSLYHYQDDLVTKTYHRSRISLFHLILRELLDRRVIRNCGNALDIGCNAGFYAKVISDFGFRDVFGIDISPEYIAAASATFHSELPGKRISFAVGDAGAIPQGKTYDLILCTEVIEHTPRPEAVVQAISRLLAPGGAAIISLPNRYSQGYLTAAFAKLVRRGALTKDLRDHLQYPSYAGPRIFRRQGLQIIYRSGVNCLFNDFSLRLLYRTPVFGALNRLNFWLSQKRPFREFAQFVFFVAWKDPGSSATRNDSTTSDDSGVAEVS